METRHPKISKDINFKEIGAWKDPQTVARISN